MDLLNVKSGTKDVDLLLHVTQGNYYKGQYYILVYTSIKLPFFIMGCNRSV